MAVPVVASSTGVLNNTFTSCQIVFTKPSGLAVGDLMTAEMWTASSSSATPTLPSGWAIPSGATTAFNATFLCQRYVAYKVADSGDVAATTFTFDIAAGPTPFLGFGVIKRITGAHATTPINGTPTNQTTTTGTTGTFPSATTSVADCLVLLSAGMVYNTGATPSGSQFPYVAPSGTTLSTNVPDDSNLGYLGTAYFSQVSAGATGSKTVATPSLSSSNGIFQAVTLAIAPDAGVTGSLAAPEAKDTASFTGNIASVGSLAAIEAPDVAALAGTSGSAVAGDLIATEAKDVATLTGAVSSVGSLGATEPKDTATITGSVGSVGNLAATETKDAGAFAGAVASVGLLAATDSRDTATLVGAVAASGTLAASEAPDTAAFVGSLPAVGSLAAVDLADTAAIAGQVVSDDVTPSSRIVVVLAEVRLAVVLAETRIAYVASETRTVIAQSDGRQLSAA